MALAQRGNLRRTIVLLAILAVIVTGGGIYLWVQNRSPETGQLPGGSLVTPVRQRSIITDFSDELFNDPRFTALEEQAVIEIPTGVVGKENPFSPSL